MREHLIEALGCRMRYQDLPGTERPLLFIHGLGCAGSFDNTEVAAQPALAGHRRILVDLLGAGYSDAPADFDYRVSSHARYLSRFIDTLGLHEVIAIGHSLGGPVAIELAALRPDAIMRLILTEPNLDPSGEGSTSRAIASASERTFVQRGFRELIEASLRDGNTMWAATAARWYPAALHRFACSGAAGGDPSWRDALYCLPIPSACIFGANTPSEDERAALAAHGVALETVPNAGHSMAWENPSGLAGAILRAASHREAR
ncbi:alpha/beta hydrolase fold protein [Coriobacterium glomerans PW2]|uniref:Alpha/beta hydrolase fold protein n=1 Tax=Coriobacterium glomerans (strain ATCC 49209 / DSM 20642 / JCM 10262 / PW2) TaxID=700015 RepID=F2N7A1_CORGP|nr:alpha/beta hydrolase [Coriobacterium glomerans]AEB06576.1 alpha/beta hydrolase fold protein [Coriobacterium glomerans PW2]